MSGIAGAVRRVAEVVTERCGSRMPVATDQIFRWDPECWIDEGLHGGASMAAHAGIAVLACREAQRVEQAVEQCQSPIEVMMLIAFCYAGASQWARVTFDPEEVPWSGEKHVLVTPQAAVGRYRADFLLEGCGAAGAPGEETRRLVVECDGHRFHERTKDQASRDKRRDREMQKQGLRVFRYSGSDVWRDVVGSAEEAIAEATGGRRRAVR